MNKTGSERLNQFYHQKLKTLKLQEMSKSTILHTRVALRRVTSHFDCFPDELDPYQLKDYFEDL